MPTKDFSKQGKLNRAAGARFELKVREDLEKMGWTVSKWMNSIDNEKNKIIPAKRKFNPFLKTMIIGTGFPDFIAFKKTENGFEVIGVEVKTKGLLDKIERGQALWLIKNKIFSRLLIARKKQQGKRRHKKDHKHLKAGRKERGRKVL